MLADTEKRIALVHRVLVPDEEYPREYAILVTDKRSIFIRQPKTRNSYVLRGEMKFGTALITDVAAKTLEDYAQTSIETLIGDSTNLAVPHENITSFSMKADKVKLRPIDFWQWLTMRMQKETFQVYNFEMQLQRAPASENRLVFYAVPLGAYFKPKRAMQTRDTILHEYALDALEIYRKVLPARIISAQDQHGSATV